MTIAEFFFRPQGYTTHLAGSCDQRLLINEQSRNGDSIVARHVEIVGSHRASVLRYLVVGKP